MAHSMALRAEMRYGAKKPKLAGAPKMKKPAAGLAAIFKKKG